ncbi:shugoshin 1 isoform X1 [Ascaphus truei]|uniref:shugoshin 1 isoform X1 n=1 Tax=Ascaphus truei TaxID=8439 RepID=UPI003F5A03FE
MAKEKCLKKTFQDSLEDIKERMKEKRTKKLAKVATVHKALSTKVQILNNSSVAIKSYKANNQALALALEEEKLKTRQALDLILHLKREHQMRMFEIFMLRRKLNLQKGSDLAESKLASLKEIITKVTHNLLETANLLGPAHMLCSSDNTRVSPSGLDGKHSNESGTTDLLGFPKRVPVAGASRFKNVIDTEKGNPKEDILETPENVITVKRVSKGRSSSRQSCFLTDKEQTQTEEKYKSGSNLLRNVSIRRRHSNLKSYREDSLMTEPLEDYTSSSGCKVPEQESLATMEDCLYESSIGGEVDNMQHGSSLSKEEFLPLEEISEIASSTPIPKPEQISSKSNEESRAGRESVRKGRADGTSSVQLKKPWENSKPRARSKRKERGASKQTFSKEKMDASLTSGDAYDFVFEESVHVTPFRQNKEEEREEERPDESDSDKSSSEEELDDSLYVPYMKKSKNRNCEQNSAPVPTRPRSKRSTVVHHPLAEEEECKKNEPATGKKTLRNGLKTRQDYALESSINAVTEHVERGKEKVCFSACANVEEETSKSLEIKVFREKLNSSKLHPTDRIMGEPAGAPPTPRFSLSDVTNLSGCFGGTEAKKLSCPLFNEHERKKSRTPTRKRRCTVVVNYAEPKLSGKLRRGDRFTDTEFLHSPIFKQQDSNRKSIKRRSLARYNEAFVGCR